MRPTTAFLVLVLAAAPSLAQSESCVGIETGYNYNGHDLPPTTGLPLGAPAACCDACNALPACRFFTFNPNGAQCNNTAAGGGCCHLKTSKAGRKPHKDDTSGEAANAPPTPAPTPRPAPPAPGLRNILWLQADDLRPNLNLAHAKPWMLTPHMDALAARSLVFRRAYVQQQVCSPSRNSYMTGRRPDRTRVWNFIDDFRLARDANNAPSAGAGASWSTLPGYFRNAGYNVFASGKTFHPNRPENNDVARSWTSYDDEMPGARNMSCNGGKVKYAPKPFVDQAKVIEDCEENDSEALLTAAAVTHVRWATAPENASRPFFIAMGHHKPHLPWNVPARFFAQYGDPTKLALAAVPDWPASAPSISWHPWFDQQFWNETDAAATAHRRRVAYYAAVSYFDEHVGVVLAALRASGQENNTAVLLMGDHGWHLGERNMWEKKGLDELDTHIPLIVAAPWLPNASRGVRTTALAEAVDVMPTLIDLAGLPPCADPCVDGAGPAPAAPIRAAPAAPSGLQGQSLMPALLAPPLSGTGDASAGFKQHAFSQFPRCNCTYEHDAVGELHGACRPEYDNAFTKETGSTGAANHHVCLFTPSSAFDWMGYSVRSDTRRYTLYVTWDGAALRPRWTDVFAEELYDHSDDGGDSFDGQASEPTNLLGGAAVEPADRADADALKAVLVAHFSTDN